MTHNLYVAVSKSASVCWYSELRKKGVCASESFHRGHLDKSPRGVEEGCKYKWQLPPQPPLPPGFLQPNSRHFCADFSLEQEYSEARNHVVSTRNLGLHSRF